MQLSRFVTATKTCPSHYTKAVHGMEMLCLVLR